MPANACKTNNPSAISLTPDILNKTVRTTMLVTDDDQGQSDDINCKLPQHHPTTAVYSITGNMTAPSNNLQKSPAQDPETQEEMSTDKIL